MCRIEFQQIARAPDTINSHGQSSPHLLGIDYICAKNIERFLIFFFVASIRLKLDTFQ
jgi:hypothetical protein